MNVSMIKCMNRCMDMHERALVHEQVKEQVHGRVHHQEHQQVYEQKSMSKCMQKSACSSTCASTRASTKQFHECVHQTHDRSHSFKNGRGLPMVCPLHPVRRALSSPALVPRNGSAAALILIAFSSLSDVQLGLAMKEYTVYRLAWMH